ncbi:MAG: 1-acyl-sn-glycerol-3-phosphate acyltransferase [Bacteroidales bacterium]|nr:1-acyl-sn-glycerol-3-phosphate acyltransferase [Bacteroidales bacterium]
MENFDDIRPYNEEEAHAAYLRLMDDARFQDAILKCLPDYSIDDFRRDFDKYHGIDDVQADFIRRFIEVFTNQSSSGVEFRGMEHVDSDKAYLYIANHRDITFDSALLQLYFFQENRHSSKIAVGDNLIKTPVLGEVARLNKMILVKRSGSLREKIIDSRHLSAYIQHSILDENESVWIAQRDGRTKDGYDYTKQGLLKMITMSDASDVMETIRRLHITPLTVSYEYEPCDSLKARELALSENGQHYQKRPGEDFDSIKQGIFGYKGRISLVIGKPLDTELDDIPANLNNNDKLHSVCELIDRQIYQNYKLYPNNYIAHDLMTGNDEYRGQYTEAEREKFQAYLQKKAVVRDVAPDRMMRNLLRIYANPVNTHFGKNINPIL